MDASGTVLAVHTDRAVLDDVERALRGAGFTVAAFSVVGPAVQAAREGNADVAVVGAGVALEYLATIASEADHLLPRNIPVVLTAGAADEVLSHRELVMRSSDYVLTPIGADELVHRVRTAIHRNRLREKRRNESAVLRERVRGISDAIRHTSSPPDMIDLTLAGVGEALDADEVRLHVFDDHRVSCGSGAWVRGEGAVEPTNIGELLGELRELGTELWRTSGSIAIINGEVDHIPAHLQGLRELMSNFTRSGLLLPIGEGSTAFGVLWIVVDRGRRKWSNAEVSLLQHLLGNLAHGVVQGQLIIGQQQVLDRLRELDSAKDNFVATVHHELRTPLSSILGYVELLQDGDAGELPRPAEKMLAIIERNGQRLSSLVENVLALSVLDAGTELAPSSVDVVDLVETVVTDLRPIASAKNITVALEQPDSRRLVLGVRELLERAFVNVLSNAVKFTPNGGEVTARFGSDDNGTVRVAIEDTGIGIPAEELPELLTRFYRASNSVSAEIPGTGLGLSIAASAVARHGGSLDVQSELGNGTVVTIELPKA